MTTLNKQVAAGGKDSYQTAGTADTTATVVNGNGTAQWGAFVFDSITIPQGATITSAYFEPYYTSGSFDDPNCTIYLENVDNPAALASAANDISARSLTTGTAWIASNVGTGFVQGPDIGADVQTVINRGGWASGNSLCVISRGTGSGNSRFACYDTNSAQAAKLTINYTSGSQTLTGAYITATTTLYAAALIKGFATLAGAFISATTTLYAPSQIKGRNTLVGGYIAATTTLYAPTVLPGGVTLTGAYIASTLTVYAPAEIAGTVGQSLVMPAAIASTVQLYAPMVHRGLIRIEEILAGSISDVSSHSVNFTTSDRDGRVVLVWLADAYLLSNAPEIGNGELYLSNWRNYSGLFVFAEIAAEAENFIAFNQPAATTFIWVVVVLSGVDEEALTAGWITSDDLPVLTVSETFSTNSMVLAVTALDAQSTSNLSAYGGKILGEGEGEWLRLTLLTEPVPTAGAASVDIGMDYDDGPPTAEETIAIALRETPGRLYPPALTSLMTVYAPAAINLVGQTLNGAYISPTAAVYAPTLKHLITGVTIASSVTLYAPTIAGEAGPPQFIVLPYMGNRQPQAVSAPYLSPTTVVYAPAALIMTVIIASNFIQLLTVYAPSAITAAAPTGLGAVYAPVSVTHV